MFGIKMKMIKEKQDRLADVLHLRGVGSEDISNLIASGYFYAEVSLYGSGVPEPCLSDSFYGSKWFSGFIPIDQFLDEKLPEPNIPTYEVHSLNQIKEILNTDRHSRYHNSGRLSFRGQTKEYFTKRPYPHPTKAIDGAERLVIPSFWRQFSDDWMKRFDATEPRSIFTTTFADELIYYGIFDWRNLPQKNYERYGVHTMSDLEDFPDAESQEYGRRWRQFKVEGLYHSDLPMAEQHYGIDTCGLDITFDVAVAAFFASNKFKRREGGVADYETIADNTHQGVIYGFVFTDPPLKKTSEMVKELNVFNHIPPIRPLRQKCALPFFHATNMNEAICDLDFIMYLSPTFDSSDLPLSTDLFPDRKEDPFYEAILEVKRLSNGAYPYSEFVEYQLL